MISRQKANQGLKYCEALQDFISDSQLEAICDGIRGEESEYFLIMLAELSEIVGSMAKTYEQDGKGDQATVYLHYFIKGMDWYISEKDIEEDGQYQAYGWANLGYGFEQGYISIKELLDNNVELDLHFRPKTWAEVPKN